VKSDQIRSTFPLLVDERFPIHLRRPNGFFFLVVTRDFDLRDVLRQRRGPHVVHHRRLFLDRDDRDHRHDDLF
jgi:hypothetical protein